MIRTKVLADVVEALVGAIFLDGGLEVARLCIQKLIPKLNLSPPTFEKRLPRNWQNRNVKEIEVVVGYKFRHPFLLVEALTHPSFEGDHLVQSYQRLEFLGDAVLDAIIAPQVMQHKRKRSPGEMTRIKAAIVNGHLLGFFCLEFECSIQFKSVQQTSLGYFKVISQAQKLHLWQLIRCSDEVIRRRCDEAVERLRKLGPDIRQHMHSSLTYPWTELTALRPEKFFSDIVESLLGAIYVDSSGSLGECVAFLERIGVMGYFTRLLEEDVDVVHPRTRLDWKTGSRSIDYNVTKNHESDKYSCSIFLDGEAFLQVDGCESSDEAIVTAAQTALLKLSVCGN
jgi:dsRNA-specific ribonuclease